MSEITIKLIEGTFNKQDAKEILLNMMLYKINYHKLRNWSSQERFSKEDELASKRLPSLIEDKEKLLKFLHVAGEQQQNLQIEATIHINFAKDPS